MEQKNGYWFVYSNNQAGIYKEKCGFIVDPDNTLLFNYEVRRIFNGLAGCDNAGWRVGRTFYSNF